MNQIFIETIRKAIEASKSESIRVEIPEGMTAEDWISIRKEFDNFITAQWECDSKGVNYLNFER